LFRLATLLIPCTFQRVKTFAAKTFFSYVLALEHADCELLAEFIDVVPLAQVIVYDRGTVLLHHDVTAQLVAASTVLAPRADTFVPVKGGFV
jgi:hypothetical protein